MFNSLKPLGTVRRVVTLIYTYIKKIKLKKCLHELTYYILRTVTFIFYFPRRNSLFARSHKIIILLNARAYEIFFPRSLQLQL